MEENVGIADIHRIDEGGLLVEDEVSVVGHPRRDRPDILKALLHAVVDSDVVDRAGDLWYLVHSSECEYEKAPTVGADPSGSVPPPVRAGILGFSRCGGRVRLRL